MMPSGGAESESELEDRLRGLIFTNQTPQNEAAQFFQETHQNLAGSPGSLGYWNGDALPEQSHQCNPRPQHGTHPPKSSKRRPNQAQRRQMSTELSMAMASQWNQDHTLQQPDLQHSRSASHPLHLRRGVHPNGVRGERQPSEYRSEMNTRSTAWYNVATAPPPRLIETPTNTSRHSNWRQEHSLAPQTAHYFPTTSLQYSHRQYTGPTEIIDQAALLDKLCHEVVSGSEIDRHEIAQKEEFRQRIEAICQQVIADYERRINISSSFPSASIELKCFGSLSSGFATQSSDMDLGLFSPLSKTQPDSPGSPIPRMIEKGLLEAGYGARLLSRTRVPIIKLCENPSDDLRHALLAERAKWESGADLDLGDGLEDQFQDLRGQVDEVNDANALEVVVESSACARSQLNNGQAHSGIKQFELKQNANSSLTAYFGLSKRVLRRAGGRDITLSNHREFSSSDWALLNHVCQASVQGLHDDLLRRQLESRLSLSFRSPATGSLNRSLAGVFTQIEGEQVLLDWEHFLAKDAFHDSADGVHQAIKSWVEIQNKSNYGDDPLGYNKELQSALERLKTQPAIQLMRLAQDPNETPTKYHSRAYSIMRKLGGLGLDESMPAVQQFVLAYISGIQDETIRSVLSRENASSQHNIGLEELGQKHKCLHLARELERAIDHQVYDQHLTRDISEYIRLLRMPLVKVTTNQGHVAFRTAMTKGSLPILSTIRLLSDPRKLAINQPRDKFRDPLEFPTSGVGVQCDINFSAHLALQNTKLLRCYSLTDPRVRPMVLFIKRWAKVRGINSSYRGTLSSYGFVLMVLHYLVNVSNPFVCPNLQQLVPSISEVEPSGRYQSGANFRGYNVQFWQDEHEIRRLAANHQLTHNTETIGHLIRGFFEYFAQSGLMGYGMGRGFDWGRDVLSLRTQGGLLTKQEKGWTGAKTVFEGHDAIPSKASTQSDKPTRVKEVRLRYLLAIEDPFELDHNVARTVTHNGIVSIRDEFRRAWKLIRTSNDRGWSEDLLSDVTKTKDDPDSFEKLLEELHG